MIALRMGERKLLRTTFIVLIAQPPEWLTIARGKNSDIDGVLPQKASDIDPSSKIDRPWKCLRVKMSQMVGLGICWSGHGRTQQPGPLAKHIYEKGDARSFSCIAFRKPGAATIFLLIVVADVDIKCVRGIQPPVPRVLTLALRR
jgi:hypothetical protein